MTVAPDLRQQVDPTLRFAHAGLAVVLLALLVFLAAPLAAILKQAVEDSAGRFVGIADALRRARGEDVPGLRELWLFIDEPSRNPYARKFSDPGAQGPI